MSSDPVRIASLSDVHLGHHNTPTHEILANLYKAFPDNEVTGELDAIFIGGDLFDRLLNLKDPAVIWIKAWANRFLRMCKKRDILVRVLEGTGSHDWGQNWILPSENENSQIGADLKYFTTLSIEYIERLGRSVLWVPDDLHPETDDTWTEVVQLLQEHNLQHVDLAVVHGAFTHQLPPVVNAPMHRPERYLSIVRDYVFGAHIHKASVHERILCNGSFDRIAHGEEEPKGHWRVTLDRKNGNQAQFIENKNAKAYITIDCTGLPVDDALTTIREVASRYPEGSHMRIRAGWNDPIMSSMDLLRNHYPLYRWTSLADKKKETQAKLLVDLRSEFTQVAITSTNIEELLMAKLRQLTTDPAVIERCRRQLTAAINT